ncbi:MAG: glutaredoxin 3 [Proteobacteria bacterium]|nr:glutaredoxin 3 [Pseudomonadota bacterium]
MKEIILYGTLFCPYCFAAKRLLRRKNIVYTEIRVDKDHNKESEMIKKSGRFAVPQIFVGDFHLGGYEYMLELNRKGKLDKILFN